MKPSNSVRSLKNSIGNLSSGERFSPKSGYSSAPGKGCRAESLPVDPSPPELDRCSAGDGVMEPGRCANGVTPQVHAPSSASPSVSHARNPDPREGPDQGGSAAPGLGPCSVAGSSLDYRTHNDRDLGSSVPDTHSHLEIILYDFGEGDAEAIITSLPEPRAISKGGGAKESKTREEMNPEQLQRSVGRAKRNVRHRIIMMGADRMLTLTKRGGFPTLDSMWKAWGAFAKRMKRTDPDFQAVAVPELHKNSTYHMHVALNRFYNVNVMRFHWHRTLGADRILRGEDSPGNLDIRKRQFPRGRLARYLSKYMTKEVSMQQAGRKRYASTGNIKKPMIVKRYLPLGAVSWLHAQKFIEQVVGKRVVTMNEINSAIEETWYYATF